MDKKLEVSVKIDGKDYIVSGYESKEYVKKIAEYINTKKEQIDSTLSGYTDNEVKNVMLYTSFADDYFKLKEKVDDASYINELRNNEIYELKHEVIALKTKLELAQKEIEDLKAAKLEEEKKNIKLETELAVKNNKI